LFEGKLNKLPVLDQLNISRISGGAIRYPAGYRISKKAGLSGASLDIMLVMTIVKSKY
jgi:hypothetical protein